MTTSRRRAVVRKSRQVSLKDLSEVDQRRIALANEAKASKRWALARRRWSALAARLPHAWFWHEVAICERELGRTAEAVVAARRAARLSPRSEATQQFLGYTLLVLGRLREAEAALRLAARLRPDAVTYVFLFLALSRMGRLPQARRALLSALRVDPDHEEAHYNLGAIARRCGRTAEATRHLQRAIEIDPQYALALAELGRLLARQAPEESVGYLRRALSLEPNDVISLLYLANSEWRTGELAAAERSCEKALRLTPRNPVVLWAFGEFLSSTDRNRGRGGRMIRRSLSIDPLDAGARRALRKHLERS